MTGPHSDGLYYNAMRAHCRCTAVRHREQVGNQVPIASMAQLVGRWAVVRLRGKFIFARAKKGHLAKVELHSSTHF